jgi:hypothetical protein
MSVYMQNMKWGGGDQTNAAGGTLGCLRVLSCSRCVENSVLHMYGICNTACHSNRNSFTQSVDPIPARMHAWELNSTS